MSAASDGDARVMVRNERWGFRVTDEFAVPGGGPPLWLMWRGPR